MFSTGIKKKSGIAIQLMVALLLTAANATVSVKIFSRDEGISESNASKPRIYIQNTGTETINNFSYRYFFSTENGKTPSVEPYYLPNEQIMLVPFGSGYYVQYTVTNANLTPGGLLPHSSGNCVGLHYGDWSSWDKSNDHSNSLSSSFVEDQKISFYYNGTKIYGTEPSGISGSVLREVWTNITGTSTDAIPVNTTPQVTGSQTNLDGPQSYGDNFGVRVRGYITAPTTGNYTFWIASDNDSKFYLSTNDDPTNKGTPIATVTGYTTYQQWNKYTSQKSSVKSLVAGTRYYIEILHKEGDQVDNCTVGWIKPGQSGTVPSEIVPSTVLTPFVPAVLPAIPTNLTATAISSQRIDISWTDASNNELGFKIEMKPEGGAFTEYAMITANLTSYQITGLTAERKYHFRIRAYNNTGNSDYSNSSNATTFAVPAGTITREVWTNVTGTLVSNIPTGTAANIVDALTTLETQQQWRDYYGQRIRGYIIPPATGAYYFWIASDDCSELWLSTSDQSTSKVKIASVSGYCSWREWNKYGTQKSAAVTLTAGSRYYVEILHKDGNQYDNLSVGWLKPGQSGSVPSEVIPASALSPFIIPTLPNAPGGLSATAISATQVDLTWSDNSNNEDGFRIERALGGGAFVEIGTAAANATIYHDAGLEATTQYRYQIRSYNGLGNSTSYTSIAAITTLTETAPAPPTMELNSFAVYSSDRTTLKDQSIFNGGGAVGSNLLVEIYPQAVVNGNAVSGGNITLKSQADINGDVMAAGTVTVESGATVSGTVTNNATVAVVDIPEIATIPVGTQDVTVELRTIHPPLPPGYYKTLLVRDGGTITLSAGQYTFTELFLGPDSKIILDVATSDMVDIQVAGDVEFSDRSKVLFKTSGYVPFIRFYTNDANMVRIGCDVQLNGTLTAPHGNIAMYSRAQCNGALFAKTITIEPQAVIMSGDIVDQCADNDGDKIVNLIEMLLNTDPDDAESYVPIAIPSVSCIDNSQDVTITYDFSVYFPDYAHATAMEATFPEGSLTRSFIPLLITVRNMPENNIPFDSTGYEIRGRYFEFLPENDLVPGSTVEITFPEAKALVPNLASWFQVRYDNPNQWICSYTPPAESGGGGGNTDAGRKLVLQKLKTIAAADPVKPMNATLYYDDGIVYRTNARIQLLYTVILETASSTGETVTMEVECKDLVTGITAPRPVVLEFLTVGGQYYYGKTGTMIFDNPVQIEKVTLFARKTGDPDKTFIQTFGANYTIGDAQTMQLRLDKTLADMFVPDKYVDPIELYLSKNYTFESANFGDGRITADMGWDDASTPTFSYEYFMKDHLGSTRMAVNDAGGVNEEVMYQPYGTMVDLVAQNAELTVREKFTGKEFDEEGPQMGRLEFEMAFDFDLTDLDFETLPNKFNRVDIYYTDYGTAAADAEYDRIDLLVDDAANEATAKGVFTYSEDKQVKWMNIQLNYVDATVNAVSCAVKDINEAVGPGAGGGKLLKISKATVQMKSELPAVLTKSFFTYENGSNNHLAGVGKFYFGARYYDPELGVWGAVDPKGQFFNGYAYAGVGTNPIIFVDAKGEWIGQLLGQMAIGALMSTAQYAISSGGNITQEGLVFSLVSGAAGGALSYGTTHLLGNVLTFSPAANAVFEPLMHGVGTFLIDAAAQGIAYGKVDWNQSLIRGGVAAGYSVLNVALNGALINPRRDFGSVEAAANELLAEGHWLEHPSDLNYSAKLNNPNYTHRIGGLKSTIRAANTLEEGRTPAGGRFRGANTSTASSQWHWRNDYRSTLLHEIYHTYTAKYNEEACDLFAFQVMQLLEQ